MSKTFSFVQACLQRYKTDFKDDWIEDLEWSSLAEAQSSVQEGQQKINDFVIFCFVNIAKSLLCGEYIVNRTKFDQAKINFKKYWDQEIACPSIPGIDSDILNVKIRLYELYRLLNLRLRALFDSYSSLVVAVDEKLDYGNTVYILKGFFETPDNVRSFQYFNILRNALIPLCEFEHYLEYSDDFRRNIAQCVEELELIKEKESNPDIVSVLAVAILKGRFILKKLIRKDTSFHILLNCDKKTINRDTMEPFPAPVNRFFQLYEKVHERAPFDKVEMQKVQLKVSQRSGSLLDMIVLMEYYCVNDFSSTQIDNLLKSFEGKYQHLFHNSFHSDFDNHALATLRNFVHNCRLSYRLRMNHYTLADLDSDMDAILTLQNDTLVNNFFPYKKALEHLDKLIRAKIDARDLTFNYEYAINLFDKFLKKLDSNIEWCESHKFYPIQLILNECGVEVEGMKLFLPSTITRPVDYAGLRELQLRLHASLEFFKTSQIYIKDREDAENIKEELKGIEKRYLEIGGVLIGVVTFLFGTINIFTQSNTSPRVMFFSVLGLGIVLLLFACVIVLVSDLIGSRKPNVCKVIIFSLLILIYSGLVAVMAFNPTFLNGGDFPPSDDTPPIKVKVVNDTPPSTGIKTIPDAPSQDRPVSEIKETSKAK